MEYGKKRWLIISITILLLILSYALKNYTTLMRIAAFLSALYLFYAADRLFNLHFNLAHYFIILFILTSGILLSPLYFLSTNYDKILHFINPIIVSILLFYSINKLKIDFKWKVLLTFTSIITIITLFEIGEFAMDKLWDMKLQGVYLRDTSGMTKYNLVMDRNDDTMIDIILGTFGAFLFYIGKWIERFYHKIRYKKINNFKK